MTHFTFPVVSRSQLRKRQRRQTTLPTQRSYTSMASASVLHLYFAGIQL